MAIYQLKYSVTMNTVVASENPHALAVHFREFLKKQYGDDAALLSIVRVAPEPAADTCAECEREKAELRFASARKPDGDRPPPRRGPPPGGTPGAGTPVIIEKAA